MADLIEQSLVSIAEAILGEFRLLGALAQDAHKVVSIAEAILGEFRRGGGAVVGGGCVRFNRRGDSGGVPAHAIPF